MAYDTVLLAVMEVLIRVHDKMKQTWENATRSILTIIGHTGHNHEFRVNDILPEPA